MPVAHFQVGGVAIDGPVGAAISDHKALEIEVEVSGLGVGVIVVNFIDEVGDVDAGVGLA